MAGGYGGTYALCDTAQNIEGADYSADYGAEYGADYGEYYDYYGDSANVAERKIRKARQLDSSDSITEPPQYDTNTEPQQYDTNTVPPQYDTYTEPPQYDTNTEPSLYDATGAVTPRKTNCDDPNIAPEDLYGALILNKAWMYNGYEWVNLPPMSIQRDRPHCSLVQEEVKQDDGPVS